MCATLTRRTRSGCRRPQPRKPQFCESIVPRRLLPTIAHTPSRVHGSRPCPCQRVHVTSPVPWLSSPYISGKMLVVRELPRLNRAWSPGVTPENHLDVLWNYQCANMLGDVYSHCDRSVSWFVSSKLDTSRRPPLLLQTFSTSKRLLLLRNGSSSIRRMATSCRALAQDLPARLCHGYVIL